MTCFPKLTELKIKFSQIKQTILAKRLDRKGVALLMVLAAMATLSVFIGEITYTAQINQKLAYDRLDQVKAQALAKSGLKLALLRIRAYQEIKKTIAQVAGAAGASADAVNSMVPKSIIEKVWSEPVTIPFSGDLSGLPSSIRDALTKFRKDSSMEGKLYISIEPQSNKFNLNSIVPQFAAQPTASPSPKPGTTGTAGTGANPTPSPGATYDVAQSRKLLNDQITTAFQAKMDKDDKFRDAYRGYVIADLVEEIIGYCDLSYDSPREQMATVPFKKAPYYNLSELHYLQTMDDQVYNLLSDQFTVGVASAINVNAIKEPVLRALVPGITDDEVKKFFDYRDNTGENAGTVTAANQASGDDNSFKSAADFFKYIQNNVKAFASATAIGDLQNALAQRGVAITTDESNFLVHIEATVQQTKRILEAMVSVEGSATPPTAGTAASPTPTPIPGGQVANSAANSADTPVEKSNIKITQLRFL
jgi:type II secretory pathway component PulK